MRCFLLLCAITAVLGTTSPLHEQWRLWKERHGKVYADQVSENARLVTWQKNRELVAGHNQDSTKHGYTLALNQFADLVSCQSVRYTLFSLVSSSYMHNNYYSNIYHTHNYDV